MCKLDSHKGNNVFWTREHNVPHLQNIDYAVSRKNFIVLMFILVDKKAWTQWYKLLSWEANQQVAD